MERTRRIAQHILAPEPTAFKITVGPNGACTQMSLMDNVKDEKAFHALMEQGMKGIKAMPGPKPLQMWVMKLDEGGSYAAFTQFASDMDRVKFNQAVLKARAERPRTNTATVYMERVLDTIGAVSFSDTIELPKAGDRVLVAAFAFKSPQAMETFNAANAGFSANLAHADEFAKAGVRVSAGYRMSASTMFAMSFLSDEKAYNAARATLVPKVFKTMGIFNIADYLEETPTPAYGTIVFHSMVDDGRLGQMMSNMK